MAAAIERCIADIQSGGRLARSLERDGVFPAFAVDLISMGEESGRMEEMLERVASACDARVERRMKRLLVLVEPVLVLGLGAVIAVVIIAILMAMLGLNELVV